MEGADRTHAYLVDACRAVIKYDHEIMMCANDPAKMTSHCTSQGDTLDDLYLAMLTSARLALAKAGEKENQK